MTHSAWIDSAYLIGAVCFILALKLMNSPRTARKGNWLAAFGMLSAIAATLFLPGLTNFAWIAAAIVIGTVIGVVSARKVEMTAMPQMVALFNGLGGGAVALVALLEYRHPQLETVQLVTTILSLIIGSISFSGSMVAFAKLQEWMTGKPITYGGQQIVNLILLLGAVGVGTTMFLGMHNFALAVVLLTVSLMLGVLMVLPIGGADMPVVISLLNSFTGCAAGLAGFVLNNSALLIGGGLVGASGLILTLEMCRAMNRSLGNVVFGAFGSATGAEQSAAALTGSVRSYSVEDAAIIFGSASNVVIVPGYGMAVAQAQHAVKELAAKLNAMGVDVKYAVHPVAGRMPGHMNVLLAEADVPYDQLYELDEINPQFAETDVALVIGANDVVNPAARTDKSSPIYGMPILDVDRAKTVIVCKRGMNPGFAGIENELFLRPNTIMVFGNAKSTIAKLAGALDSV